MKYLIISDTHGSQRHLWDILEIEGNGAFDQVLHMGDTDGYEDEIEIMTGCPVLSVKGNNDWGTGAPDDRILSIGAYTVWMTHGHRYSPYWGIEQLRKEAIKKGADIVLYGHTHIPHDEVMKGIRFINPGSLTYPRQPGRNPSYIVATLTADGKLTFDQKYLD